jgi:hypothetical protein
MNTPNQQPNISEQQKPLVYGSPQFMDAAGQLGLDPMQAMSLSNNALGDVSLQDYLTKTLLNTGLKGGMGIAQNNKQGFKNMLQEIMTGGMGLVDTGSEAGNFGVQTAGRFGSGALADMLAGVISPSEDPMEQYYKNYMEQMNSMQQAQQQGIQQTQQQQVQPEAVIPEAVDPNIGYTATDTFTQDNRLTGLPMSYNDFQNYFLRYLKNRYQPGVSRNRQYQNMV